MKNFVKKLDCSFLIIIILCTFFFSYNVYARDNTAASFGSTEYGTDEDVRNATYAYYDAGYTSYGYTEPQKSDLWEKLYADVQFFSGHGNVNHIIFLYNGLIVANGGNYNFGEYGWKDVVGTDEVHWDADTILATYSSCYSSGNNESDYNSIAGRTMEEGCDVTVGFRQKINPYSATSWNKNYNEKLAEGYGVYDAIVYANSKNYLNNSVKQVNIFHENGVDYNMKIGKYRNSNSLQSLESNNILKNTNEKMTYSTNNICNAIKSINNDFDLKDYSVSESSGIIICPENGQIIDNEKYITMNYKLNDFITTSGYTIRIKNNTVTAIYDNTINSEILSSQKLNLSNPKILSETDLNLKKQEAIESVKNKYNNSNINIPENEITYDYVYDIENQKYKLVFSITTTSGSGDFETLGIENIEYIL